MHAEGRETIQLPSIVDFEAAQSLLGRLQAMTACGTPAALDAAGVESLSYPAMQVILSWSRSQPGALVCRPSAAFEEALAQVGLSEALPLAGELPPPLAPAVLPGAPEPVAEVAMSDLQDAAPAASKRILTIDDSKTMRDMLRLTLERSGFDVLQAVDGCDGLEVLGREEVDIIITDINMPRMDGYGVIENVRRDSKYDATPILVLTTESDREKKDRARDLGATGFIVKPFDPSKLVDVIAKVSP